MRAGQTTHIVMRLDRHRRPTGHRNTLDHIRIKRALGKKVRPADLCRLLLEHLDEQPPDRLALGLRVGHAGQRAHEQISRIAMHQSNIETIAECRHHLRRLVLPQQPVIDEDAHQLVADRLMDQHRGHRAVHTA